MPRASGASHGNLSREVPPVQRFCRGGRQTKGLPFRLEPNSRPIGISRSNNGQPSPSTLPLYQT